MDNELLCMIDMFTNDCTITYPDNTREIVPLPGVLEFLYDTCKTENISTLHLFGNKNYINGLIEQHPPLDYGCGKVEIKVN